MTSSAHHNDPARSQSARLERMRADFAGAWERTADLEFAPDLLCFLPPPGDPLRHRALEELIEEDLLNRWRRKERILLDQYLERFNELGGHDDLSPRLILAEYRTRHLFGDNPPAAAY